MGGGIFQVRFSHGQKERRQGATAHQPTPSSLPHSAPANNRRGRCGENGSLRGDFPGCLVGPAPRNCSGKGLDVFRLRALRAFSGFERYPLSLRQRPMTGHLDGGIMDKEITPPVIGSDEPKTLRFVKPLNSTSRHGGTSAGEKMNWRTLRKLHTTGRWQQGRMPQQSSLSLVRLASGLEGVNGETPVFANKSSVGAPPAPPAPLQPKKSHFLSTVCVDLPDKACRISL